MRNPRVLIALTILSVIGAAPIPASAQAQRTGPTFGIGGSTGPVILPDAAYDSLHDRYLVVSGNGFIEGQLLNAQGARLAAFPVHDARHVSGYSQNPRVAFSPDVNNGAGGYLVTWHESVGPVAVVVGRLVSWDGALLTAPFTIATEAGLPGTGANWTMGAAVAYSTGSREFLVAWMGGYFTTQDIRFNRVSIAGAVLQAPVAITSGADWERDPAVAYSPHDNEFYIVYAGYRDALGYGYVAGQRVRAGTGALVPSASGEFIQSLATLVPAVAYSFSTRHYVVSWYNRTSGSAALYGISIQASTGGAASGVRLMSGFYFAYDANDLDYNPASGDFLLVTHGAGAQTWEDAAVSIRADGTPYDNGFILTQTHEVRPLRPDPARSEGNFNPRIAAATTTGRYLTVTSSNFAAIHGQFATSTAGGPVTPPPPPPPLSNPLMNLDVPGNGTSVSGTFAVAGWAVDLASRMGSGVSAIHVWALPTSGANPIFLGAAGTVYRPDIGAWLGQEFRFAGFGLSATLPPGTYDIRASALSAIAGTFNNHAIARITVVAPLSIPGMWVDLPAQNQTVSQNIAIAGWAVDLGSSSGTGVDAIHVWAYPVGGGNPLFVGVGTLGHFRPDVAAFYGHPRFGAAGYFLQGNLPPGWYYLVVFAHSTVTGTFNQSAVVVITVR